MTNAADPDSRVAAGRRGADRLASAGWLKSRSHWPVVHRDGAARSCSSLMLLNEVNSDARLRLASGRRAGRIGYEETYHALELGRRARRISARTSSPGSPADRQAAAPTR